MIAAISWLIWLGISETTATWLVTSKILRRVALAVFAAAALAVCVWYLIHVGGERREAEIRRAWAAKFAAIAIDQQRRALDRHRADTETARAVEAAHHAVEPVTVTTVRVLPIEMPTKSVCPVISVDAVRKLNAIR